MRLHQSIVFCVQHLCVVFSVFSMILVCGFLDPLCNTIVSLPTSVVSAYMSLLCIFHVGMPN